MNIRANIPAPMLPKRGQASALFKAAAVMLRSRYQGIEADAAARLLYGRDHGLDTVLKAASAPATIGDPQWAGLATQNLIRDLLQAIVALSAAASLMEAGIKIDLSGLASITVPGRLYDPSAGGAWIAEGVTIPMRAPLLTAGPKLTPHKLAVLSAYTREMVESSAIESFVRMAITEAAAALLDTRMFSTTAADASGPAGILTGATTVVAADPAGAGGWIISKDIGALVEALAAHGGGLQPVLIAAPGQAASLRMWKQQDFYEIYPSVALAAGTVVAIEASSFVSAVDAVPNFNVSIGSAIHAEDTAPTDIVSGGTVATPVKSFFQTDTIGLKMTLRASWGMRNPAHVAIVSGVSW